MMVATFSNETCFLRGFDDEGGAAAASLSSAVSGVGVDILVDSLPQRLLMLLTDGTGEWDDDAELALRPEESSWAAVSVSASARMDARR